MTRFAALAVLVSGLATAQAPRAPRTMVPWWDRPLAREINLTDVQRQQIRSTVIEYRPKLIELRARVEKAESDLQQCFNTSEVDVNLANRTIDDLANARQELTRTVSQMALRLRLVLTKDQWTAVQERRQEVQRRRRGPGRR